MFNKIKSKIAETSFNNGEYFDKGNRYNDAIAQYKKAIQIYPEYENAYDNLGNDYININDYQGAIEVYRQLIDIDPQNAAYHNMLGVSYSYLDNSNQQQLSCYKQAINLDNSNPTYYTNLGDTDLNVNNYKEAVWAYQQAIKLSPQDADYYNSLGVSYSYISGENKQAVKNYRKAINLDNSQALYYANLGLADLQDSNYKGAIWAYQQAINLDPKNGEYYENLGKSLYNMRDYKNAKVNYYKAVQLNNNNASYYNNLGIIDDNLHQYTNEINAYKVAVKLNPNNDEYFNHLGVANSRINNNIQAKLNYQKALSIKKKPIYYNNLGISFKSLKQYQNAVNTFTDGLKTFPKSNYVENFYNGRSEAFYSLNKFNDEIKDLRSLLTINSESDVYINKLGVAYYKLHMYKKSVKYYKLALSHKNKPLYYSNLARAYKKLHNYNAEGITLQQAMRMSPNNQNYKKRYNNIGNERRQYAIDKKYSQKINPNVNYQSYFDGLIGLGDVKKKLDSIIWDYKVNKARTNREDHEQIHLIFEGAPGTGKTTVAKLFSKILYQAGVVKSTHYVSLNATELSGKYQGAGTRKVKASLHHAINGVLFIDEAYSLASQESNVKQAVDTLMTGIENHKNDIVAILAGYTKPMENLLNNVNPGLRSRFPTVIRFKNYSNEECFQILKHDMSQDHLRISSLDNTEAILKRDFYNWASVKRSQEQGKFGNARAVRNIYDKLRSHLDYRIGTEYGQQLSELKESDPQRLSTVTVKDVKSTFEHGNRKIKDNHDYLKDLDSLIGLDDVKKQIRNYINQVKGKKRLSGTGTHGEMHLVFEGAPGTGKTTVAKLFSKILYQKNIIPSDNYVEINATNLESTIVGGSAKKARNDVQNAMGGVLFIDEAYAMASNDSFMKQAVDTLMTGLENHKNDIVVILAGYTKPMENMLNNVNPGLRSRFPTVIRFKNYSNKDCWNILKLDLRKDNLRINSDDNTRDTLKADLNKLITIKRAQAQDKFGNARTVRNIYDTLRNYTLNRIANMPSDKAHQLKLKNQLNVVIINDVTKAFDQYGINTSKQKAKKHDYVKDLDQLIGLKDVKNQIKSYIRTSKMNKVLGNSSIGGVDLVFEGSPGTGKTTVARLFAHILHDIGIVKSDKFKEIQGSDLTGEYLGQTKTKARKLIHSALGGLLFIDEAYTLTHDPSGSGGSNDYKDAAVAELVAEVENHRKDLAVILAGYTPQMKAMFKYSNPGLRSRFRTKIIFPNYSNEECFEILQLMFHKKHIRIDNKETKATLKYYFIKTIQDEKDTEKDEFGNGRSVRNIVQKLIAAKNNRWAVLPIKKLIDIKSKDPVKLYTVTSEDVHKVFKD